MTRSEHLARKLLIGYAVLVVGAILSGFVAWMSK